MVADEILGSLRRHDDDGNEDFTWKTKSTFIKLVRDYPPSLICIM